MSYVVILFGVTFGGFIATLSFTYFVVTGSCGGAVGR
ncbi:hypothetical protein MRB58_23630 (plasmid) [Acuticoccus sp. I52.16.1]|nr:hypothetical protein [Acuticoccus sp. I52.16.1]UOM37147.1 hypothetical protein MRB58_23630 [Acuticoccus sp. I52.16.1]